MKTYPNVNRVGFRQKRNDYGANRLFLHGLLNAFPDLQKSKSPMVKLAFPHVGNIVHQIRDPADSIERDFVKIIESRYIFIGFSCNS